MNSCLYAILVIVCFSCLFSSCKKGTSTKQDLKNPSLPGKIEMYTLSQALYEPTVEARLDSVQKLFRNGDFINSESLLHLAGIPIQPRGEEPPDINIQRAVIEKIFRIQKLEENFVILLDSGLSQVTATLPIFKRMGNTRLLQGTLDLKIEDQAKIWIIPTGEGLLLAFEGIKVGKGWIKVTLPNLIIDDNWGYLLGLQFWLER